jgi:tetraacyldisaccharide 4'-kinase
MRALIEQKLNETWYGERKPGWLLSTLERVYRAWAPWHQKWNHRHRDQALEGKPIIVVGNLTAGGSGKTPVVIRLCEIALSLGLRPGVVSRGYGRLGNDPVRVDVSMDARETGDEPLLIAQRTGVPVQVDSNREMAVRNLLNDGVNLVIADDGLQRRRLPRWLEVCVVDPARGFGNGRLLPAGPLREPADRLGQVDFIIENKIAGNRPQMTDGHSMRLQPGVLTRLRSNETISFEAAASWPAPVYAVAGIAQPERFFELLERQGLSIKRMPFADHHRFSKADFESLPNGASLVMTEKDAVKCRRLPLHEAWYLPVEAVFSEALELAIKAKLELLAQRLGAQ